MRGHFGPCSDRGPRLCAVGTGLWRVRARRRTVRIMASSWKPERLSKRRRLANLLVPPDVREKAELLKRDVGELGVDPFGFDPEAVKYVTAPLVWLYRHYFRVMT